VNWKSKQKDIKEELKIRTVKGYGEERNVRL
jgi:hypothetical protein